MIGIQSDTFAHTLLKNATCSICTAKRLLVLNHGTLRNQMFNFRSEVE